MKIQSDNMMLPEGAANNPDAPYNSSRCSIGCDVHAADGFHLRQLEIERQYGKRNLKADLEALEALFAPKTFRRTADALVGILDEYEAAQRAPLSEAFKVQK